MATLDVFKARLPNLLANRLRLERLDREAAPRGDRRSPCAGYNELAGARRASRVEPALVEPCSDQVEAGRSTTAAAGRGIAEGGCGRGRSRPRTCSS